MYRPLPDGLTIKKSPIEGLGLYATKDIKANTFIGLTHILDERFENNYEEFKTKKGTSVVFILGKKYGSGNCFTIHGIV